MEAVVGGDYGRLEGRVQAVSVSSLRQCACRSLTDGFERNRRDEGRPSQPARKRVKRSPSPGAPYRFDYTLTPHMLTCLSFLQPHRTSPRRRPPDSRRRKADNLARVSPAPILLAPRHPHSLDEVRRAPAPAAEGEAATAAPARLARSPSRPSLSTLDGSRDRRVSSLPIGENLSCRRSSTRRGTCRRRKSRRKTTARARSTARASRVRTRRVMKRTRRSRRDGLSRLTGLGGAGRTCRSSTSASSGLDSAHIPLRLLTSILSLVHLFRIVWLSILSSASLSYSSCRSRIGAT